MEYNITELKKQAELFYSKAQGFYEINQLSNACNEYKKAISVLEKIYHYEPNDSNLDFLLNNYLKVTTCYNEIYKVTDNLKDLSPAKLYYEKIIYFYEDELKKKVKKETLEKVLETYLMLLWVTLEVKDSKGFIRFKKNSFVHAKKIIKLSKKYESLQYLILLYIFEGDHYVYKKLFKKAYFVYYIAMRKLNKIYKKLPQDGIRNDLILVYKNLSEVAKILNKSKQKIKWDKALKQLGGN